MEVCLHEVVKFETRANLVRESEWTEDTAKPVLTIEPVDVFTTDANQVDYADLAGEFEDTWSDKTFEDNLVTEADCHEVDVFTTDANQVDYGALANEFTDTGSEKTFEDKMVTVNGNTSATRQSENLSTWKHCLGESHGRDDKRTRKSLCPACGSRCTRCQRTGHYPETCYECAYCASWGHNSKKCEACQSSGGKIL